MGLPKRQYKKKHLRRPPKVAKHRWIWTIRHDHLYTLPSSLERYGGKVVRPQSMEVQDDTRMDEIMFSVTQEQPGDTIVEKIVPFEEWEENLEIDKDNIKEYDKNDYDNMMRSGNDISANTLPEDQGEVGKQGKIVSSEEAKSLASSDENNVTDMLNLSGSDFSSFRSAAEAPNEESIQGNEEDNDMQDQGNGKDNDMQEEGNGEDDNMDVTELHEFSFISETEYHEIMAHQIEVEVVKHQEENDIIKGNRIVDLQYVTETCMKLQYRHSKQCTLGILEVYNERRHGLHSTVIFRCNVCSYQTELSAQRPNNTEGKKDQLNYAAVWASMSAGNSFKALEEILSVLNVKPLSYGLYHSIEMELANDFKNELWKSIEEAGKEERRIAMEKGQIDDDGIPWTRAGGDGGWSRRSYGNHYDAASGVGVIIGKETKKILYLGVRNKYCCVCARAENKGKEASAHVCFKNWAGSSGAMEADIIVEGFKQSIEMHGLRYLEYVGDGDSSVFAKIQKNVPYGHRVRKIACRNHVIKNYGKYLYKMKKDITGASKYLTSKTISELEDIATKAIYTHALGNVEHLKTDLESGPAHVFGDHRQCKNTYCDKIGDCNNTIDLMELSGVFTCIKDCLQKVVISQGHKLIDNETNNRSELFMSILCKFNVGKRLNTTQKGSFETRAYLSGLRYNKGADWQDSTWEKTMETPTGSNHKSFIDKYKIKSEYWRKNPVKKSSKPKAVKPKRKETDYGPNAIQATLTEEEFTSERNRLLQKLKVSPEQIAEIAKKTVGQWGNHIYEQERANRLTASNFGEVCSLKRADPDKKAMSYITPSHFKSAALDFGITGEIIARNKFAKSYNVIVQESGIFIDPENNFLGASPDGLVGEDEIIEIKSLYGIFQKKKTLDEAVREKNNSLCVKLFKDSTGKEEIKLKTSHKYYYQVQGQLNICGRKKCYFIIFIGDKQPLFVQEIERNEEFWNTKMLPKLKKFYMDHMLPAIIKKNTSV